MSISIPKKFFSISQKTRKKIAKILCFSASSVLLFSGLGISFNGQSLNFDQPVNAQTACDTTIRNVTFTGRTSGSMTGKPNVTTNVRSNTTTSASILTTIPANTALTFSGWAYGQGITDIWSGGTDYRWFRVTYGGKTGWVASGVIYGNPPNAPIAPNCSSSSFYQNPEVFFNWVVGRSAITRLDRGDLVGQCVTLVARYVQEVKLPASQRTVRVAYGNGIDTASVVASSFSTYFQPVTRTGLPTRGAVISFYTSHQYGHTGIVMESRTYNGQRQIRMLESNWDSKAPNTTVRLSPWFNLDTKNGSVLYTARNWTNPR